MSPELQKIQQIQDVIAQAELSNAKAQGQIEAIKEEWKSKFGTDDIKEIRKKLDELNEELESLKSRRNQLYDKLVSAYDWDKLEEELC